jgi:hypothetical protein
MLFAIVQHTPVWVWGLLTVLLAAGLWQTRDRQMSLLRITVLPLVMVVLSLSGVLRGFGPSPVALSGWAVGAGIALALARQWLHVRGAVWSPGARALQVPGSWLPLALMLGLFAVKYFAGVNLAMNPALASDVTFAGLCSLAYGCVSGTFMARALALRSLATSSPMEQAA